MRDPEPTELRAGRWLLRPPSPIEAEDALAMSRDPDVMRWNDAPDVLDVPSAVAWCDRGLTGRPATPRSPWSTPHRVAWSGTCRCSASIGTTTSRRSATGRRRGPVANDASCAVARAAGFQLDGVLRQSHRYADGHHHDEHLHARVVTD